MIFVPREVYSGMRLALLSMLAALFALAQQGTVRLKIVDEKSRPVAARIRLSGENPPPLAGLTRAHRGYPALGAVVAGEAVVALPAGRHTMNVERGPEYRPVSLTLDVKVGESIESVARLVRWIDLSRSGWWSGDTHVHSPIEDLPLLMDAADLRFAPAITCFNNAVTLSAIAPSKSFTIDNCEDERPWGAALFLGTGTAMALHHRASQYPPPTTTWAEARRRGAFIDFEKVIWWQSPMMMALQPPDTIGVASNHFQEDTILTRATLSRPRDEAKYPGPMGYGRWLLDLYCTYLNAGFRIPASAGSANGVVRNHLGHNRSYVHLDSGFTIDGWMAGQKAGRNFVTNGPILLATVNGRLPGSTLAGSLRKATVRVDARSARELDRAEILVDGEVSTTLQPRGGNIRQAREVAVRDGGWVAVRVFEKNAATIRFAHTSPVWIGPKPRRAPEALVFMREWIDADMNRIRELPSAVLTDAQREETLALAREAHRVVQSWQSSK